MNKENDEEVLALDQPTSSQLVEQFMAIMAEANVTLIDLLEGVEIERYGEVVTDFAEVLEDMEELDAARTANEIYQAWLKDPSIAESWDVVKQELIDDGLLDS